MKIKNKAIKTLINVALLTLTLGFSATSYADDSDSLYISDGGDNSVKRFDAKTGTFLGYFVSPGSNSIVGPRGLIFTKGNLNVVNQNAGTPYNGEVLRYHRNAAGTGDFLDALVSRDNPNAPWAPRGIIRGSGDALYVADHDQAKLSQFNAKTGGFVRNLDTTGFTGGFFPRGVVHGPDDLLYVSVTNLLNGDPISGSILRFNPRNGKFVDVFASNTGAGCAAHLHRPEGLVFGPDGKLYVTSFRADASDTDKVLVFNGKTGKCVDEINLDQVGGDRFYAQSILFGPKGWLFVPALTTGEVRRYNVKTKTFNVFIPAGGALQQPWYMTFGETDPRTLEYDD